MDLFHTRWVTPWRSLEDHVSSPFSKGKAVCGLSLGQLWKMHALQDALRIKSKLHTSTANRPWLWPHPAQSSPWPASLPSSFHGLENSGLSFLSASDLHSALAWVIFDWPSPLPDTSLTPSKATIRGPHQHWGKKGGILGEGMNSWAWHVMVCGPACVCPPAACPKSTLLPTLLKSLQTPRARLGWTLSPQYPSTGYPSTPFSIQVSTMSPLGVSAFLCAPPCKHHYSKFLLPLPRDSSVTYPQNMYISSHMKDSIRYIFFRDLAFLLLTLYLGDLSKSIHPELLYSFLTAAWGPAGMDSNLLSWLLFVAVQIVCTFSLW